MAWNFSYLIDLTVPLLCLALNIYHEARTEPLQGQLAVALVTLNRAHNQKEKICDVVFEPSQFSWTLLPVPYWEPVDGKAWLKAQRVAKQSLKIEDFTHGATYFHAVYIPFPRSWGKKENYIVLGEWGRHIFYKRVKNANTYSKR